MKKLLSLLILATSFSFAQNTLHYNDEKGSPKATLLDVSWISGKWTGEALGGICEENWSEPIGNSMMFNFKLVKDGKVAFYEFGHIVEKDRTLLLQLKHFSADLKGWEKPEISEEFRLVKIEENRVYFNQFTFERVADNEMNIYVVFEESGKEMKFNYKK
ncbi:MAG: DUF6265 family protein [Flavobacterium sp.]|jgi:hypothetical protein